MKKFTVYNVYLDDDNDVYKIVVPAESEADAVKYCEGNGDIIAVKKNDKIQKINTTDLTDCLRTMGWGKIEIDIIVRALAMCGLEK